MAGLMFGLYELMAGGSEDSDEDDTNTDDTRVIEDDHYVSGDDNGEGFNIRVNFIGKGWGDVQKQAFIEASDYLSEIILSGFDDPSDAGGEELVIDARLPNEDLPGGVFVQANSDPSDPRLDNGLPTRAEVNVERSLSNTGSETYFDTVFHEMVHALGLGDPEFDSDLIRTDQDGTYRFIGQNARLSYATDHADFFERDDRGQEGVPLDAGLTSNGDLAYSHWSEAYFESEIMSGETTRGSYLSNMTIAALEDMGYDTIFDDLRSNTDATGNRPADSRWDEDETRTRCRPIDATGPGLGGLPICP